MSWCRPSRWDWHFSLHRSVTAGRRRAGSCSTRIKGKGTDQDTSHDPQKHLVHHLPNPAGPHPEPVPRTICFLIKALTYGEALFGEFYRLGNGQPKVAPELSQYERAAEQLCPEWRR